MSIDTIKVKFLFEDELRAISLHQLSFEQLLCSLEIALKVSASCLLLRYVDNEGETVTVGSDPELQEAVQTYKGRSLKLIVQQTDKPQLYSFVKSGETDKSESASETHSDEEVKINDVTEVENATVEETLVEDETPSKAEKKGEKKLLQREQKRMEKNCRKEFKREKQRSKNLKKQEEKMLKRAMKQNLKGIEESKQSVSQEVRDAIIELENLLEQQREKRTREVQALKKEISQKKEQLHAIKRESDLREEILKQKIKELKTSIKSSVAFTESQKVEAVEQPEMNTLPKEEGKSIHQQEVEVNKEQPQVFQLELEQLTSMGFFMKDTNLTLLHKHNGNMTAVVEELLSSL